MAVPRPHVVTTQAASGVDRRPLDSGRAAMTDDPRPSDGDLLARVVAGDQTAFATVYDRHIDVIYGSVLRFVRDRQAAEELVQDTYLAAWRHAGQYEPAAGSVLGWLLGIARHKSIDRARAIARRPHVVRLDGPEDERTEDRLERAMAATGAQGVGIDAHEDPELAAVRAWERAVVRGALGAIPPAERRALELAYDEGLSQSEVAARLGWPLGTVKTRTRRGLGVLRAALESVPGIGHAGGDDGSR
jgi:RNA polymerase sigma-70 factor (ECF subfamily)